jgi:hypothetical protein
MQTDFDKTGKLYRKIDLHVRRDNAWKYICTTQQWKRCKDARVSFAAKWNMPVDDVKANFVA